MNTGFINGYRWGVEYPTNGKKPDLPDDIYIDVKCEKGTNEWQVMLNYHQALGRAFDELQLTFIKLLRRHSLSFIEEIAGVKCGEDLLLVDITQAQRKLNTYFHKELIQ